MVKVPIKNINMKLDTFDNSTVLDMEIGSGIPNVEEEDLNLTIGSFTGNYPEQIEEQMVEK